MAKTPTTSEDTPNANPSAKKSRTIAGLTFEISIPYHAGHVITEGEAAALNQVRLENIGNNLRSRIAGLKTEGADDFTPEQIEAARELVATADSEYTFTIGSVRSSSRTTDPLERMCLSMAREYVHGKIKSELGVAIKDYKEANHEKYENAIAKAAASEQIVSMAKSQLEAKSKLLDLKL